MIIDTSWIKPGSPVVVYGVGAANLSPVSITTIDRLTSMYIFTAAGEKFSMTSRKRVGGTDYSYVTLASVDSNEGRRVIASLRMRQVVNYAAKLDSDRPEVSLEALEVLRVRLNRAVLAIRAMDRKES